MTKILITHSTQTRFAITSVLDKSFTQVGRLSSQMGHLLLAFLEEVRNCGGSTNRQSSKPIYRRIGVLSISDWLFRSLHGESNLLSDRGID